MATYPNANAISNAATVAVLKTLHEDVLARSKQLPGASANTTLTISGDAITPTGAFHLVESEGAGADDLKNAATTNVPNGSFLFLSPVSSARPIRVFHSAGGSGQFILNSGNHMQLGDPSHLIAFQLRNTSWQELFRVPSADLVPYLTKTSAYTVTLADRGRHIVAVSGTWTLTLPDTALAGVGFEFSLENRGDGIITIDPAGTDFIDEASTIKVYPREAIHAFADAAGRWIMKSRLQFRPAGGYIFGLTLKNDTTDATNDLQILAGECASDDQWVEDRIMLKNPSTMIKQIDAAWAAGTGAGGRTGVLSDGTWNVYGFRRSGGAFDVVFDKSLTPTLPDSGTHKRILGAILVEGSAIVAFVQFGDEFWRVTPTLDINRNTPGTTANTETLKVPTGYSVEAILNVGVVSNADGTARFSALDEADGAPATGAAPLGEVAFSASGVAAGLGRIRVRTNASGQIRSRVSTGGAGVTVKGATLGWVHPRGKY